MTKQEHAYQRLTCLYEISKLLTTFANIEHTLPIILNVLMNTLPFLTAVLIEKKKNGAHTTVWHTLKATAEQISAVQTHAKISYGYLVNLSPIQLARLQTNVTTPRLLAEKSTLPRSRPTSGKNFIGLPLVVKHRPTFGFFQLASATSLNEQDIAFINSLTNLIAITLDRYYAAQAERALRQRVARQREISHRANQLTQQKKMTALMKTEQKLQIALRARDDLMSICGHEFNTPLCILRLHTQIVKKRLLKGDMAVYAPENIQQLFHIYDTQIERMIRLVADMLDITRINHGKLTLHLECVNLSQLTHDIVHRLAVQLETAGCVVNLSIEPNIIGTWDHFRIEQILINLLTNAMRYGKKKPITISIRRQKNQALICVSDQGVGIAKENQQRIFHRFERIGSSNNNVSGLGLGLYIIKEILDALGGSIRVKSKLTKGTTFTVKLPLAKKKR